MSRLSSVSAEVLRSNQVRFLMALIQWWSGSIIFWQRHYFGSFLTGKSVRWLEVPGVSSPENVRWFEFHPGRTPVVRVVFVEVLRPNWVRLFSLRCEHPSQTIAKNSARIYSPLHPLLSNHVYF